MEACQASLKKKNMKWKIYIEYAVKDEEEDEKKHEK